MLETNDNLGTLIARKDSLNILRYLRFHKLRKPKLALQHGKIALKQRLDDQTRRAVLHQMALAAIDEQDHETAQDCLNQLRQAGVSKDSARFRLLLGQCLEASGDLDAAAATYEKLLQENPSCQLAMKRQYCILKSQVGQEVAAVKLLQEYLQQNRACPSTWYELARQHKELGNFAGAAYALEQVVLTLPVDARIHTELAECLVTVGKDLHQARLHYVQALELKPNYKRAQIGLVICANAYLEETQGKKMEDEFETQVATELVKYGADKVLESYKGSDMYAAVKNLMKEYTDNV